MKRPVSERPMPTDPAARRPPRVWSAWALGLCAIAVAPIWASRFLPLLDEPNHLSAVYIWKSLTDPRSPLHDFYDLKLVPLSYLLEYGLAYLGAFAVGVERAHKLVLSAYVLSFPAAGALWSKATGRSPWLGLTTLPLAYSVTWSHGYSAYNAGLAACLFAIVTQDALLRRPTAYHGLLATALAVATYFGHPFALAMLWVCTGALWLAHWRGRAALASALSLVPSIALYRWQSSATSVTADGTLRMLGPSFPVHDLARLRERVLDFADYAVNPLAGERDAQLFCAVLAVAALLLVVCLRASRLTLAHYRSLLLALVLLALYFVLPDHFEEPVYVWIARGRFAAIAAFFLLLTPDVQPSSRLRIVALLSATLGACVPLECFVQYRVFAARMHGMENVLAACPAGEEILTLRMDGERPPPGYDVPVFRQLSSWVQVVHGGFTPLYFPRPIPFPFAIKKALPSPRGRGHEDYAWLLKPDEFGCVLTMGLAAPLPPQLYQEAARDGEWVLWVAAHASKRAGLSQ
jgi:hypothetical protein